MKTMGTHCYRFRILNGVAAVSLFAYIGPTQEAKAQQNSAGPSGIQEIVVTAEHRVENAQSTPIAMSVYNSDSIKRDGIERIEDLTASAPDINFANFEGEAIITVRGISSRDTTENGDPAVTVSTDGFYRNRPYSLGATLYDIDRIELLRGPQGTLAGRNSVGGAVNVVTAQPTNVYAGYGSIQYGNFNDLEFQGMGNIPLNDKVQVRAAFLSATHDGYRNNSPQPHGDDADNKSGRIEIAVQPTDKLRGLLTVEYSKEGGAGDVVENIPYVYSASGALDHDLPAGINPRAFYVGTAPSLDLIDKTIRLNVAYDINDIEFTLLGGYDQTDWHHMVDDSNPYSNPSVYGFQQNEFPKTYNAEFRIASIADSAFQWQAGAFFFGENSNLVSANAAPLANGTFNEYFGFKYWTHDRSEAGYGQASYQITDKLKLTGGVRFSSDSKGERGFYGNLSANIVYANQIGSSSSTQPTYHVALDYSPAKENLLYAKVDSGYKAGGFNFGGAPYQPETVTAYEVGSKNRFVNDTLQVNAAAFYNDYTNQQVSTFAFLASGNPVQLTENAGASRIYGLEGDIVAQIGPIGTFSASIDYLNARFTNFLSVADPSDPQAHGNVQLKGNTPPQAPTLSANFALEHKWLVYDGSLTGRIQTKIQSSSNFSFYNFADSEQKSYTMSNLGLTYAPNEQRWKVTGYVKNLENSTVFAYAGENQYANSYTYEFYPPRTYGMRLEYSW